jgi:hypothetical protein
MIVVENMLWYVGVIGLLHAIIAVAGGVVVTAWRRLRHTPARGPTAAGFVLFNCAALVAGTIACGIWTAVAWNRWYISMDPLVIYQPFIPFGEWVLELKWGDETGRTLAGVSVLQLQVLWAALTIGVWLSAWLATRSIRRRRRAHPYLYIPGER